jgi:phosphopantothenoylcysteine synthetase/decarboxylase
MEDHDPHAHAERKQQKKNFDLIVLNGPENVGSNRAKVEFFSPTDGWSKPFEASKLVVARRLVERAEEMVSRRKPR